MKWKLRIYLPLLCLVGLLFFFGKAISRDPHKLPSALINRAVPRFSQPDLLGGQRITQAIFKGHVSVLHVWATWCITCQREHPVLMDIARKQSVAFYGLNYKDNPHKSRDWLKMYGNPYQRIISDQTGRLGVDLGISGTPETFIIDQRGIIRYKYTGPVSLSVWQDVLAPQIRKWQSR